MLLEVADLNVHYGAIQALQGISFTLDKGEIVTLIGANGAGKSTTLRTISGLLRPRRGAVRFRDRDITMAPAEQIVEMGISHVPEGRKIFAPLSVRENLEMGAHTRRDREQAADLDAMMELFPVLRERAKQSAGTLSGGEQEMLAIARALMSKPRLCIFDEPSLGLAPKIVAEVEQTLARIKAMGVTVLLVEQNASMALRLADRAYVYEAGEIVLQGTGTELQSHPEVSKAYLGY